MRARSVLGSAVLVAAALALATSACKTDGSRSDADQLRSYKTYDAVELIPRAVLFGNPSKLSPALSPDGKRIAYLAPDQGVLNVWIRTMGEQDDQAVTQDRGRGIRFFTWAENSAQLLYVQDQDGDENWHIYAIGAEGGEARDLTPVDGVQARFVAKDPSQPDKILVALNDRDPKLHDVYSVNLKSGERKLEEKNELGAVGFVADHKLKIRIAEVVTAEGAITLMHKSSPRSQWKELLTWAAEDSFTSSAYAFDGDNKTLYVLSSAGSDTSELRALNVRNKREQQLHADPEADVDDLLLHPTQHKVQAVSVSKARKEWKVLDAKLEKDFATLRKIHPGDLNVVSRDRADNVWIVAYTQDEGPIAYFSYDRAAKSGSFLFSHRPELEELPLAEMQPISYQARDGLTIHGYMTLPPEAEPKLLPAVIVPHGGPWHRDSWGYDGMAQWLANRGYAVLQVNFRGSTGYGKKFINAGNREWGGKMQDDITDGAQWLIDRGYADHRRVGIMGGSYGGYATLMGLIRTPELYQCGVDIVGVANLVTWLQNLPPYWEPFRAVITQRVGDPEQDLELLRSRSPVFFADKIQVPLLIAQGANDPRVPKEESLQIRDALQEAGRKVEYVEFPDEGHGFARPENRLKFFAMAEGFLAEHLGGRFEPPSAEEGAPPAAAKQEAAAAEEKPEDETITEDDAKPEESKPAGEATQ